MPKSSSDLEILERIQTAKRDPKRARATMPERVRVAKSEMLAENIPMLHATTDVV